MAEKESTKPTPPSQAPGESGDPQAWKEAEEAVVPGTGKDEGGESDPSNSGARRRAPGPVKSDRKGE